MNPNIQILANLARDLMDGQQPPTGKKLEEVENAIQTLQKYQSSAEYELLGVALLGVVVDRVLSEIRASATLQKHIRGDRV